METTLKPHWKQISAIVVDDDPDIVAMTSELLELGGIKVLGIGYNGKEAVELYQNLKPDVAFLDIMMPEYDGFYAIENMRVLDGRAKILMVTADMRQETEERLRSIPAIEVVYKTFDLDDLLKGLNKLYGGRVDKMAHEGVTYAMVPEISE